MLYPAIAEVSQRGGADAVGLIDVGCGAGLNLLVDRVRLTYSNGQTLGDLASAVQMTCAVVGDRPVPGHTLPAVVARVGTDREPLTVTTPDDVRRLRAAIPPGHSDARAALDAQLALAALEPPTLLRGRLVETLPQAVARIPAGALPVVVTTWTLSRLTPARRLRFVEVLEDLAAQRDLAWVSVEGVGVAPGIPTFGDRPASGHSIIGLALIDSAGVHAQAAGRCWLRGQMMSWLAG